MQSVHPGLVRVRVEVMLRCGHHRPLPSLRASIRWRPRRPCRKRGAGRPVRVRVRVGKIDVVDKAENIENR